MKFTKHFLLAIALLGISGIYLPFVTVRSHGIPVRLTARELSFGFERTHKVIDYDLPSFAEARLPGDVKDTRDDVRLVAGAIKWAFAVYIPFGLLLLIGISAQFGGRLGRGSGIIVAFLGLVCAGAWFGLRYACAYAVDQLPVKKTTIELAPGAHILIIIGVAAFVIGLVAAIKPEPKRKRRRQAGPYSEGLLATGMYTAQMNAVSPPAAAAPADPSAPPTVVLADSAADSSPPPDGDDSSSG
ncbi:MAG TPA: hypothetical protein VGM90_02465 [Kofleriaceae bacterium]|jgi:hypothetical protein